MREAMPGDIIYVQRLVYKHYGVYIDKDCVIHYDGKMDDFWFRDMTVRETQMYRFLDGKKIYTICECNTEYSSEEIIARAREKIGQKDFHPAFNNCEHFARWCRCNTHKSHQVGFKGFILAMGRLFVPSNYKK